MSMAMMPTSLGQPWPTPLAIAASLSLLSLGILPLWLASGDWWPGRVFSYLAACCLLGRSCYRSFPALPGLYSYTGGELVVGKSWLRHTSVRWLRKALT